MRSLYVTQELAPFFAEGGLGLTGKALPDALGEHCGLRHDIVLPCYPRLLERSGLRTQEVLRLPARRVGGVRAEGSVHRLVDPPVDSGVYLIRSDAWYDRPGMYRDEHYAPFADEAERAAYFGWCVARWLSATGPRYGLVHGNDWQSGAAMAHLRARFPRLPQLLTVHNGLYRGDLTHCAPATLGLPARRLSLLTEASRGRPSLLLAAVQAADAVATCSSGYAAELVARADEDPVAAALRETEVTGIPFGVDGSCWDPGADGHGHAPFGAGTVAAGKRSGKRALQRRLALREDPALPVLGVCSRLVPEKGTDLLLAGLGPLLRAGRLQLVLVGPATDELRRELSGLAEAAPGLLAHVPRFDQDVAWLLYAGSDLTVMPSRSEPGGLNQLIAYRYGTLPLVSPVGGLRDTVVDLRRDPVAGTGFFIAEHTALSVRETVLAALAWIARSPDDLDTVRRRVMEQDWSWAATARRYAVLYRRLLARAEGPDPDAAVAPAGAR
ncbi:glycogen synthase [Streptomyces sp. H51]|uniref:glycogen synthase n=1 Tax=Streptomyces sp. H51 TaxID=3111770 RepID=UPI002D7A263F|nr:glycogen/starch synthase [Streptomyces sp. H51]